MKLKNKLTGEIKEVIVGGYPVSGKTKMWECSEMDTNEETGYKSLGTYTSLAELNAEWEDMAEEPKEYWYIGGSGEVWRFSNYYLGTKSEEIHREIGNLFETKKEAEKAVEKLKAWKRLRDNGFKFVGTNNMRKTGYFINYYLGKSFNSQDECEQAMKDLDLLFSGVDD